MTGSSRNSKATSSRSSKRSERLSSSIRTTQGVARRARLYSARDERGKRGEPRRFFHHQTLARAYTISKPAGKFDWRFHCVQQGAHDDHDQPSERINPIFCMKNGEIGQHVTGLFIRFMETNAGGAITKQTLTLMAFEAATRDGGRPTDISEGTRTDRALSEQNCSLREQAQ